MSGVELWTGGWEVNRTASEGGLKVGPGVLFFPWEPGGGLLPQAAIPSWRWGWGPGA